MKTNKKILILLVSLITLTAPAYAFELSKEFQAGLAMLLKITIYVIISSIIIGIGLWAYSRLRLKNSQNKPNGKALKFKCDIDDTETIDEAISTFLKINS